MPLQSETRRGHAPGLMIMEKLNSRLSCVCLRLEVTMRIANVVHGVPFAKVNEGNIIQFFDRDGKLYTGIKIYCENWKGVLFLKAPPPYKRAGIFPLTGESRPWDQDLMLEFPDAILLSKEFDKLPAGHKPRSGDLTMHHDGKIKLLTEPNGRVL